MSSIPQSFFNRALYQFLKYLQSLETFSLNLEKSCPAIDLFAIESRARFFWGSHYFPKLIFSYLDTNFRTVTFLSFYGGIGTSQGFSLETPFFQTFFSRKGPMIKNRYTPAHLKNFSCLRLYTLEKF